MLYPIKKLTRFSPLIIMLVFIMLMPSLPTLAATNLTTVDNVAYVGQLTSMTLNSSGHPVIAYYSASGSFLKLAVCNNATCTAPTLTAVDSTLFVGRYPSITLNGNNPVISHFDFLDEDLELAVCNDATCTAPTLTTVDDTGDVGLWTSIALNSSGNVVISYYDVTNTALKLAVCNNATCTAPTLTTVDNTADVGEYTSLVLNGSNPVISYYDITNGNLKIAVCSNATCTSRTLTTVDNTANVGGYTSLALNSSGNPVISYYDVTNTALKVAVCNDATCTTRTLTTVDNTANVGEYTSLALNGNNPVISYYDQSNTSLKVAVCNNATCTAPTLTTLDNTANVGEFTSIALNGSNYPIISYHDKSNTSLRLVTCDNPICRTPPIATDDNPGATYTTTTGSTLTITTGANDLLQNDSLSTPVATISSFGSALGTCSTAVGSSGDTSLEAGILSVNANGSFTITNPTVVGTHTFCYTLTNAAGSDTATVTVTVNKAPTAQAEAFTTTIGNVLTIPTGATDLLQNDTLGTPTATITGFGPTTCTETAAAGAGATSLEAGILSVNANGSFTITNPTVVGTHTFCYTLTNAAGSDTATVTITVNEAPTAQAEAYTTILGNTLTITTGATDLLQNDTPGTPAATITGFGPLTCTETAAAGTGATSLEAGILSVNANGSFTLTNPTVAGTHTFCYTLTNAAGSDTATVTVTVNAINHALTAGAGGAEGTNGTQTYDFTITRTGELTLSSTVDFAIGGIGVNSTDYNFDPATDIIFTGTGSVTGNTITFDAGATDATVNINMITDALNEADFDITLTLSSPTVSGTGNATITGTNPETISITDDDTPGFTVTPLSAITEGTSDTYTINLNTEPTGDVVLDVTPDAECDLGAGVSTTVTVTLTSTNWNAADNITITVPDDIISEAPHVDCVINYAINGTTADTDYAGLAAPTDTTVTINDDDTPGFAITALPATIAEGTNDTYTINLSTEPTGDVVLDVTPDAECDLGNGAGVAITLTFTITDWNTAVDNIAVAIPDDNIPEVPHADCVITYAINATTVDAIYGALAALTDTNIAITDDDVPGLTFTNATVNEAGSTSATYTIVLNTLPVGDVQVDTIVPDAQCTISGVVLPLIFGIADWNIPQTVTVQAVDDEVIENNTHSCVIVHTVSSTTDTDYDGLTPSHTVNVLDNDVASSASAPDIGVFDPAISKLGLLYPGELGLTGEQLEWVVTVGNTGTGAGTNVVVTDTLVSDLQIDSVDAPGAAVGISGQTVTVTYATVNPGDVFQFSIWTTVLNGAKVDNTVCVTGTNGEECVTALPIQELPRTGESSIWWLRYAMLMLAVVGASGVLLIMRRHIQY